MDGIGGNNCGGSTQCHSYLHPRHLLLVVSGRFKLVFVHHETGLQVTAYAVSPESMKLRIRPHGVEYSQPV